MTVQIVLSKGEIALVSDEDADLAKLKWFRHTEGYAVRKPSTGTVRMHRLILTRMLGRELEKSEDTDHIDHNRLNNQRDNRRVATRTQNIRNSSRRSDNTSGYRGVSWSKVSSKWLAFIWVDKKYHYLGLHVNILDAVRAYNAAAIEFFGEYAVLNVIVPEQTITAVSK